MRERAKKRAKSCWKEGITRKVKGEREKKARVEVEKTER